MQDANDNRVDLLKVDARVRARKVVASHELHICLFDNTGPQLVFVGGKCAHERS